MFRKDTPLTPGPFPPRKRWERGDQHTLGSSRALKQRFNIPSLRETRVQLNNPILEAVALDGICVLLFPPLAPRFLRAGGKGWG